MSFNDAVYGSKVAFTEAAKHSITKHSLDEQQVEEAAIKADKTPGYRIPFQVGGVWFCHPKGIA